MTRWCSVRRRWRRTASRRRYSIEGIVADYRSSLREVPRPCTWIFRSRRTRNSSNYWIRPPKAKRRSGSAGPARRSGGLPCPHGQAGGRLRADAEGADAQGTEATSTSSRRAHFFPLIATDVGTERDGLRVRCGAALTRARAPSMIHGARPDRTQFGERWRCSCVVAACRLRRGSSCS